MRIFRKICHKNWWSAKNHSVGLFDKILVKDNHIKGFGGILKTLN